MDKKHFDATKLIIKEFKIIKGEIEAPFEFDGTQIESYQTDMSFDVSFNTEAKLLKTDIGFSIETKSTNSQKEARAKFDFVYMIHVKNLEELMELDEDDNLEDVEHILMNSIASIAYSTSRGVLMTRFQGTVLEDYILPIVNPNDILKDNI